MKWLFTLLLLLCAGFFAFMQWSETTVKDKPGLQPQSPLNADQITLLSAAESAPPVVAARTEPESPPVCMEWGEFSGEALARATTALFALKLGNALSQRQVEHTIGYWVYLAPSKTEAETEKNVAQLKALGVQDYFVIRDDEKWRNAVSLGMFRTQDAANNYLKNLTAKGVPGVKTGERTGKRAYTVFVLKNPDAALTAKVTLLQRDYPGSQLKAAACGN